MKKKIHHPAKAPPRSFDLDALDLAMGTSLSRSYTDEDHRRTTEAMEAIRKWAEPKDSRLGPRRLRRRLRKARTP